MAKMENVFDEVRACDCKVEHGPNDEHPGPRSSILLKGRQEKNAADKKNQSPSDVGQRIEAFTEEGPANRGRSVVISLSVGDLVRHSHNLALPGALNTNGTFTVLTFQGPRR